MSWGMVYSSGISNAQVKNYLDRDEGWCHVGSIAFQRLLGNEYIEVLSADGSRMKGWYSNFYFSPSLGLTRIVLVRVVKREVD